MPTDLRDIAYDTVGNANSALQENVGGKLRRLKRYGIFYRRLNSRERLGGLLSRMIDVGMVDGGQLLSLLVLAWGAITNRLRRRKTPDPAP